MYREMKMEDMLASLEARPPEASSHDALLLIDIQNDFLSGGSLAVPGGDEILEPVARLGGAFENIILSQDWHPASHKSFASNHKGKQPFDQIEVQHGDLQINQVLWPDHCVQGTHGGEFRLSDEILNKAQAVIRKGHRPDVDSYSAFTEVDMVTSTGLAGLLKGRGIQRIYLAGLALDYCVAWSALSAIDAGIEPWVVLPACRSIAPDSEKDMMTQMREKGVKFIT